MAKKNPIAAAAKKMAAAPVSNNTVEVKAAEVTEIKEVKAEAKAEAPKAEAKSSAKPEVKAEAKPAAAPKAAETSSGKENSSKGHQDIRSCTVRRQGSCRERSHRGC